MPYPITPPVLIYFSMVPALTASLIHFSYYLLKSSSIRFNFSLTVICFFICSLIFSANFNFQLHVFLFSLVLHFTSTYCKNDSLLHLLSIKCDYHYVCFGSIYFYTVVFQHTASHCLLLNYHLGLLFLVQLQIDSTFLEGRFIRQVTS